MSHAKSYVWFKSERFGHFVPISNKKKYVLLKISYEIQRWNVVKKLLLRKSGILHGLQRKNIACKKKYFKINKYILNPFLFIFCES